MQDFFYWKHRYTYNTRGSEMPQKAGCAGNIDKQAKWTKNGQANSQKYTHFESNLAMRIYLPVKLELDWTKHFRARVRKWKCWPTDKRTELHQFRKQPSYDGDLCPCQVWNSIWQSIFELESGNGNIDRQTNRQKNRQTGGITPISKGS